ELVVANRKCRQRERGHLKVVHDVQAPETRAGAQLAAETVLVARRSIGREEPSKVRPGFRPGLPVPRKRKLCPAAFHLKPATYEDVRAANNPNHCARPPLLGRQLSATSLDALDRCRALLPEITAEVGPVFPQAIAYCVRIPGLVLPVILHWI